MHKHGTEENLGKWNEITVSKSEMESSFRKSSKLKLSLFLSAPCSSACPSAAELFDGFFPVSAASRFLLLLESCDLLVFSRLAPDFEFDFALLTELSSSFSLPSASLALSCGNVQFMTL